MTFVATELVSLVGGLRNIYSPDVTTGSLYMGGWRDTDQTEDRIYELMSNKVTEKLRRPGWLINDPSIVKLPSRWVMYYTGLASVDAPVEPNGRNVLGAAFSVDDGITWIDRGILLGRWNGHDLGGVWSPGALVVGDRVWLYAHSNAPLYHDYRITLANDGVTVTTIDRLIMPVIPNTPSAIAFASNLDVAPKSDGSGYWMVGNSPDLLAIYLLESTDGLSWTLVQKLNSGNGTWVLTPHLDNVVEDGFDVLFGWTETPGAWQSKSIHRWTWRTQ